MNGKGSKPRPTNLVEYGENYSQIDWGRKLYHSNEWKKLYLGSDIADIKELSGLKDYNIIDEDVCFSCLTQDLNMDRLNFRVKNNIVIDVWRG